MINIDPYIQRLEWLKEWMAEVIDGRIFPFRFNMSGLVEYSIADVIRIFNQTGVLFQRTEPAYPEPIHMTFEEYCTHKQQSPTTEQP